MSRLARRHPAPQTPQSGNERRAAQYAQGREHGTAVEPRSEQHRAEDHPRRARIPLDAFADVVDGRSVLHEVLRVAQTDECVIADGADRQRVHREEERREPYEHGAPPGRP